MVPAGLSAPRFTHGASGPVRAPASRRRAHRSGCRAWADQGPPAGRESEDRIAWALRSGLVALWACHRPVRRLRAPHRAHFPDLLAGAFGPASLPPAGTAAEKRAPFTLAPPKPFDPIVGPGPKIARVMRRFTGAQETCRPTMTPHAAARPVGRCRVPSSLRLRFQCGTPSTRACSASPMRFL